MPRKKKTDENVGLEANQNTRDNVSPVKPEIVHVPHSTVALSVLVGTLGASVLAIGTWTGNYWVIIPGILFSLIGPFIYLRAARRAENASPLADKLLYVGKISLWIILAVGLPLVVLKTFSFVAQSGFDSGVQRAKFEYDKDLFENPDGKLLIPTNATRELPGGRILLTDVTPPYFDYIFKENTSVEASKLMEKYWGKWIIIGGRVTDVSNLSDNLVIVYIEYAERSNSRAPTFTNPRQIERVRLLKKGALIKALCEVAPLSIRDIHYKDCELVDEAN